MQLIKEDKMHNYVRTLIGVVLAVNSVSTVYAADSLYWGNQYGGPIAGQFRVGNLDGSGLPSALAAFQPGPCGIAITPGTGKIYFGNYGTPGIQVADLNGSNSTTLFAGENFICGIAVDSRNNKIYWSTIFSDTIKVGNLDGSGSPTVLYAEPKSSWPTGVAIDRVNNKLYWTNQHSNQLRVGPLSGGVATTLIGGEQNPIGVVINSETRKLYWANFNGGKGGLSSGIRTADLDATGTVASNVATLFAWEAPAGLALDAAAHKIYWTDYGNAFYGGTVRYGNLDGSGSAASFNSTLFSHENHPNFPAILKAPVSIEKPSISGGNRSRCSSCLYHW